MRARLEHGEGPKAGRLLVASLLLTVPNCTRHCGPAEETGLVRHEFELGNKTLEIRLPKRYERSVHVSGIDVEFAIRGTRYSQPIRISSQPVAFSSVELRSQKWQHSLQLAKGQSFQFSIDRDLGGSGSGGPEGELAGLLRLDGAELHIRCYDQGELGAKPEWCVPYVYHLRTTQ